jgi:hypothetical protein
MVWIVAFAYCFINQFINLLLIFKIKQQRDYFSMILRKKEKNRIFFINNDYLILIITEHWFI